MLRQLKQISLLSAWVILFAHSVVPHAHEAKSELQVCASEHEHDENLLDALGHIFHFSTGLDHLENFSADSAPIVLVAPELLFVTPPVLVAVTPSFSSPTAYFSDVHQRYRPLRAPPVYS